MKIDLEITPGDILKEEFMEPIDLTQKVLADSLGIPASRLNEVIRGKRRISPELALRLAACFGNSAQFWINLQSRYDLECAEREHGAGIKASVHPIAC